jgi:hypothetical protein
MWNPVAGQLWKGDGTLIRESEADWLPCVVEHGVQATQGVPPYQIEFSVTPPHGATMPVTYAEALKGATDYDGNPFYVRGENNSVYHYGGDALFPPESKSCDAYVGIGAGPWSTVSSVNVHFYEHPQSILADHPLPPNPMFTDLIMRLSNTPTVLYWDSAGHRTTLPILGSQNLLSDNVGRRVVAIDDSGRQTIIRSVQGDLIMMSFNQRYSYNRLNPTVDPGRIRTLLLQTRHCQVAEFKNIPLEPKASPLARTHN